LVLHVQYLRKKRGIWVFSTRALVDGETVASAELMCAENEMVV
jgi:3-hydroxyacyl-[acyl-carrier-protein] dehydratase